MSDVIIREEDIIKEDFEKYPAKKKNKKNTTYGEIFGNGDVYNAKVIMNSPKRNRNKNRRKERDTNIILDAKEKEDIKDIKHDLDNGIKLDAKDDEALSNAIEELETDALLDRCVDPAEIIEAEKCILRHTLYTLNNIPSDLMVLNMNLKCSTGSYSEISPLFKDNLKCNYTNNKMFIGRFSTYIIEYILEHIDEYYVQFKKDTMLKVNDTDLARIYSSIISDAVLKIMKGKYYDGLPIIIDMMFTVSYSDSDLLLYNNGTVELESMGMFNKSFKTIVKYAYFVATGCKKFDMRKLETDNDYFNQLGKSIHENNMYSEIYNMYIKARPAVDTKIKNINAQPEKCHAVLALHFTRMLFNNNGTVKRLIKKFI